MLIKKKSIEKDVSLQVPKKIRPKSVSRKPKYSPVLISETGGIRYLHFGTEWIQGAMRLRDPNSVILEYSRQMLAWMLFIKSPKQIVQLGLGTGALSKFCYHHFPRAKVTAVELNPEVIAVCKSMFGLPVRGKRLSVLEMDAIDFVLDRKNKGMADVIHVDLYDATERGPVLDTPEFYAGCSACLSPAGMMTVNLFGEHRSYQKNLKSIREAFPFILSLPKCEEGNIVVMAFKKEPDFDFKKLTDIARKLKDKTDIAALKWVKEIKQAVKDKNT